MKWRRCLQSLQARKSGENRYNFSIPLWFALKHHFFVEKLMSYICHFGERQVILLFDKKDQKILWYQIAFLITCNFFFLNIFRSGAKERFCYRESMLVLDQNGRIQALGFLARWRLKRHAPYYKISYNGGWQIYSIKYRQGIDCKT